MSNLAHHTGFSGWSFIMLKAQIRVKSGVPHMQRAHCSSFDATQQCVSSVQCSICATVHGCNALQWWWCPLANQSTFNQVHHTHLSAHRPHAVDSELQWKFVEQASTKSTAFSANEQEVLVYQYNLKRRAVKKICGHLQLILQVETFAGAI